jgi:hypothetical protein
MAKKDDGVVSIHGKEYLTVARRINDFRSKHPDYGVHTEILSIDSDTVVCRAVITDENGRQVSSGIAEEHRRSSKINQTSATENCETSAVGRALAFFGMAGTEIASADEVAGAISQQRDNEVSEYLLKMMDVFRLRYNEITELKDYIRVVTDPSHENHNDPYLVSQIAQIWLDWSNEDKEALWVAPSKGGVFTTEERAFLKSDEFAQARKKEQEAA